MPTDQERVKTTVVLPKPLWREAKKRAVDEDRDLNEVVIAALRAYLKMRA